jgi:hypothetical protein
MLTKLLRNKKGTAEIIGTVLFVIILLFFFTNVYLWHDAATKQMNDLYVQKLNSPIVIHSYPNSPGVLNVTNVGGIDAKLAMSWVDARSPSGSGPDQNHSHSPVGLDIPAVAAGHSVNVTVGIPGGLTACTIHFTVVTTVGNLASCDYDYYP